MLTVCEKNVFHSRNSAVSSTYCILEFLIRLEDSLQVQGVGFPFLRTKAGFGNETR